MTKHNCITLSQLLHKSISNNCLNHYVYFYAMSNSCFNKQEKTNSKLLAGQEDPFADKQEKEEAYNISSVTNSLQSSEVGSNSDSWSKGEDDSSSAGNNDTIVDNFEHMGLREPLLRGIYSYGFEQPSAIQQKAIIPCCKGQDVIAQAQSGTGKTATFAVGILQQIDVAVNQCQVYSVNTMLNYR